MKKENLISENDIKTQDIYIERVKRIIDDKINRKGEPLYVYIQTFGCQQNEADSERLIGSAINLGYEKTDDMALADLIIYNTCAVREHAELKALSKTGQLKHKKLKNPDLLIGLWGCMVTQDHRKEDIKHRYPYVDFVAGTNMLHRLPEILCDVMTYNRRRFYVDDMPHAIVEGVNVLRENDIKAWLSVMYGCDNFCTYCVVPHVRGRERSRLPEHIISEAKDIILEGFREITLLGQNVNSYGKGLDKDNQIDFSTLLQKVCDIDGEFWVRFMTSHPKDVSDNLIYTIAKNEKAAKHFHLPMQAGSDRVLKQMNRGYTSEQFYRLAEKIKAEIPGISMTTDIICGFPGETEKEFEETLSLLSAIEFDSVFSFIYSSRKGTPAEKMEDPFTKEEKSERFSKMIELQQKISEKRNKQLIGKTIKVLVDTHYENQQDIVIGRSDANKIIRFPFNDDSLYGKFVYIKISQVDNSGIFGKLV